MHGVSPTDALRTWKLRSVRTNSAVKPTAITINTIDARFMVEVPLTTRGIHQHFLEQPTAGKVAEAALVAAASKRVYCLGSGRADAVSTLIVAASALATPFTWT